MTNYYGSLLITVLNLPNHLGFGSSDRVSESSAGIVGRTTGLRVWGFSAPNSETPKLEP